MIEVKLVDVDAKTGKIKLSRKALLPRPPRPDRPVVKKDGEAPQTEAPAAE